MKAKLKIYYYDDFAIEASPESARAFVEQLFARKHPSLDFLDLPFEIRPLCKKASKDFMRRVELDDEILAVEISRFFYKAGFSD